MLAWLTPDNGAFLEAAVCRTITVPWPLLPYVTGCLQLLAESGNWEKFGSATVDDTAVFFRDVLDDYLESACGGAMFNDGNFQTILNTDWMEYPSGLIDIPLASLPTGIVYGSVLLLQNQLKVDDGFITFYGKPIGFTTEPNKTIYDTVASSDSKLQSLAYVGEDGIRIQITPNNTVQWTITTNLIGWW